MSFKKFLLIIATLSSFLVWSQEEAYKLKFKVGGVKDTVCFLANYYGDKQYLTDTAVCDSKGNFTFTGKKKLPGGVYLVVVTKKRYFEILIPNDKEQFFSCETDTANFVSNMKVSGSPENEQFYLYQNYLSTKSKQVEDIRATLKKSPKDSVALTQKLENLDKEVQKFRTDFMDKNKNFFVYKLFRAAEDIEIPANPNPKDSTFAYRYYKAHYFDKIDLADDRMVRTPMYHGKLDRYIKKMVVQIPDSIIPEIDKIITKTKASQEMFKYHVWYLNYTYETSNLMGMDAIFVHMAKKYYLDSTKVTWIDSNLRKKFREKAEILEPLLIGKIAPNAYLADSLGTYIPLHKVKAKAIVMVFWDPNCGHCQKDIPKLHEIATNGKWSQNGVAVYSVSIERTDKDWKKFINEKKIHSFINVWDKYTHTDFRKMWDIYSTPVIYLLDEKYEIKAKRIGVDQVEDFLKNGMKVLK
ncbi:MAG: DUF5106 domain-containing protein [Cytophagales bacterium]